MYHIAATLFFAFALIGAMTLFTHMLREYRKEIVAALIGEMPRRRTMKAWTRVVRVTVQPSPAVAPAFARRRAAF